jgi:MoxR-like ATPase
MNERNPDELLARVDPLREALASVVIGQEEVLEQVLVGFLAGGHVLLEGVPGVGKTLLVLALSRCVSGTFARVQFTPDLMPSDVTGHLLYDPGRGEFQTRKGPIFANFLLADEINRAPAKTQSALLETMQEGQVTIEGKAYPLPQPFMALATQNPIEQEGTYPLPEAQLDRFLLHVEVGYPSEDQELRIVASVTRDRVGESLDVGGLRSVLSLEEASALRKAVAAVHVDERVMQYAVRLVRATRERPGLAMGAGPRGAIALVRSARAHAALRGRDFVTPDDVKAMSLPVLRHRVLVAPELELEGLTRAQAIESALSTVEAPRS